MSLSSPIKLTVGIPTFNGADNILGCIESCLESIEFAKLHNIEILVIDNASTDQTFKIVSDLSVNHSDVLRIIKNSTNIGLDRNIDKVIQEARGEYVKLLGDDDVLDRNFIESLYSIISGEKFDVLLSSYLDFNNRPTRSSHKRPVLHFYKKNFEILADSGGIAGQIASITFNRSSYLHVTSSDSADGTNNKFLFIAMSLVARGNSIFDSNPEIYVRQGSPRFTSTPLDSLKMQEKAIRALLALLSHGGPWSLVEMNFLRESIRSQRKYSMTFMDFIHRRTDLNSLKVIARFFPLAKSVPSFYFYYIPRVLIPKSVGNFLANSFKR